MLADSSRSVIYSRDSQTVENERQTMPSRGRARAVTKFKIFTYFQATAHPSAFVITRCNQRTPRSIHPRSIPLFSACDLPPPSSVDSRATTHNRINCSYLINGRYNRSRKQWHIRTLRTNFSDEVRESTRVSLISRISAC